MDEVAVRKEIMELITTLKAFEQNMLDNETYEYISDLCILHMAAIKGMIDMSEALNFIQSMYAIK